MGSVRRDSVKELIETRGEIKLTELIELFPDCSSMTLRRDLLRLEEEGFIKRTRGGAVAINRLATNKEGFYVQRAMENIEAKKKIAAVASKLMEKSQSLYLDAGSTSMCFAKALPDAHLNIFTSGINIAQELVRNLMYTVIMVGGQINPYTLSCSGAQAIKTIDSVNIDIAVMSCSGFSILSGFTSGSFAEHELRRRVIEKANMTMMLMDLSKLDRCMPFTFATLEDIDVLVCESRLPPDIMTEAQKCGVKVYAADSM